MRQNLFEVWGMDSNINHSWNKQFLVAKFSQMDLFDSWPICLANVYATCEKAVNVNSKCKFLSLQCSKMMTYILSTTYSVAEAFLLWVIQLSVNSYVFIFNFNSSILKHYLSLW